VASPRSTRLRLVALCLCGGTGGIWASGCAETAAPRLVEDDSRRIAPLPACIQQLEGTGKVQTSLPEQQYWAAIFPDFAPSGNRVPERAVACTGSSGLDDPELRGGKPRRGWPLPVEEGDATIAAGVDQLRVVWLRSHVFPDHTEGGVVGLARTVSGYVEVYAVGILRLPPQMARFEIRRMGTDVVVLVVRDECRVRKPQQPCRSMARLLLARRGRLVTAAEFDVDRVDYGITSEPGIHGKFEYQLTTAIQIRERGLKLLEDVVVRDAYGTEVRHTELGRTYVFSDDEHLIPDDDALWPRVYRSAPNND
jgi:hypothetical protein